MSKAFPKCNQMENRSKELLYMSLFDYVIFLSLCSLPSITIDWDFKKV